MPTNDSTRTLADIIQSIRDRSVVAPEDVANALEEIDLRLRVIEPCPQSKGHPHTWAPIGKRYAESGDPLRCIYCDIKKVCL